ncbi:MAG: hypothetical protein HOP15_07670, partial [Planctomycetes bacterium]|nr:hypothetical protein [Planctomycetota bacterium]
MKTVRCSFRPAALTSSLAFLVALLPACGGDDPAKTPVTPRSTERGGAKGAEGALEAPASSAMLAYEMGLQHLQ